MTLKSPSECSLIQSDRRRVFNYWDVNTLWIAYRLKSGELLHCEVVNVGPARLVSLAKAEYSIERLLPSNYCQVAIVYGLKRWYRYSFTHVQFKIQVMRRCASAINVLTLDYKEGGVKVMFVSMLVWGLVAPISMWFFKKANNSGMVLSHKLSKLRRSHQIWVHSERFCVQ